ncbi:hypothetical protein [Inquilinus sp. CAU 1745]|uniref:hypothetical protein n=1 Tax=Inquilinus sp. CAU 1745 TaxID=3140369 RepID=UPI00325C17DD
MLAAAIILYGGLSSPAPSQPGAAELAIGLALVLAAGPGRLAARWAGSAIDWQTIPLKAAVRWVALAGLLVIPTIRGISSGAAAEDMARDLVPLAFLFMPLLIGPFPGRRWVVAAALGGGVLFAARFFIVSGAMPAVLKSAAPSDGLLYLANAPMVLFAAIFLPFAAFGWKGRGRIVLLLLCWAGAALCFLALAATLQRAALAIWTVGILLVLTVHARRQARLLLLVPLLAAAIIWAAAPLLGDLADLLILKTRLVGWNGHDSEIRTASALVGRSWDVALFGLGWGALFESPAVPGYRVSYLHSLPLYMLVKAGGLGLALLLTYAATFIPDALAVFRRRPALAIAILGALSVGALVQPSFKYLDFGLLLLVLTLHGHRSD